MGRAFTVRPGGLVRIEIEATTANGFDDGRIHTVSESATQLKFDESGFEES